MDEFAQLKHTLAAGKGDHPRQRGRGWQRFRRGYERIRWGREPKEEHNGCNDKAAPTRP